MNYNERNKSERDDALIFEPESHTYSLNGITFDSVTTVVENCFEQFDAEHWAELKATPERTKEMILAEWEAKGEAARNLGTQMHDRIERYYLGEQVQPDWMQDPSFQRFAAFAWDIRLCPHRSEWRIYHEESRLAGTLDFLARRLDGRFDIWDWKRSSKIVYDNGAPVTASSFGKTALEPLGHLPDTTYYHYALQVSIYRYILETKYGMSIAGMHLGIFHPDHSRYFTVNLPYLKDEVMTILMEREHSFQNKP